MILLFSFENMYLYTHSLSVLHTPRTYAYLYTHNHTTHTTTHTHSQKEATRTLLFDYHVGRSVCVNECECGVIVMCVMCECGVIGMCGVIVM